MKSPKIIIYPGLLILILAMFYGLGAASRAFVRKPSVADLVRAIEFDDETRATELIRLNLGDQIYRSPYEEKRWQRPIHVAAGHGRFRILALLLSQKGISPRLSGFSRLYSSDVSL